MACVACLAVAWALAGCQPAQGKARVVVLVGGPSAKDLGGVSEGVKADEVPLDAIQSLKTTVTEISLDFAGSGTSSGGEGEGEFAARTDDDVGEGGGLLAEHVAALEHALAARGDRTGAGGIPR